MRGSTFAAILLAAGVTACGGQAPPNAAAVDAAAAADVAEEPVVHFGNFAAEIAPDTLEQFTRATGIRVVYDVYESNTMLDAKLLAGRTGYDVVVPGNNFLETQVKAGIYQPLDRSRLPNWRNLDPTILELVGRNDPGNRYAVPYLYGTNSLGYNIDKVREALGSEPPDSWSLLFDPANARRLARCGITVSDSAWIMTTHALRYLGRDPNSQRDEDLEAAMAALRAIRPYLRDISNALQIGDYAEGELCVFVGPNADFRLARDQAREAGTGQDLRYVIPREGALLWIDMLAIPNDAPHPGNAHKLIDFLMRPEIIAKVTEATYFANANRAADPLVPPALRNDPLVYPDAETLNRLQVNIALSPEFSRRQNREFTRFKNDR